MLTSLVGEQKFCKGKILTGDSRDDGGLHGVFGEVCRVSVAEVLAVVKVQPAGRRKWCPSGRFAYAYQFKSSRVGAS